MHSGHFEFLVLSFGLAGGPSTFNGGITETLHPLLRKCVLLFFDDILVFSRTLKDHVAHLGQVFQLLQKDQWKIKASKCSFGQKQISYLGHVVSAEGVATEPSKIQTVAQWPTPADAKEVRRFLGLAGYYRHFVRHFGIIASPLFNLLKKGAPFVWTQSTDQAFQLLKQGLITTPVLTLPDFSKPFVVETDACDAGVGAILQQQGNPIAYMSKALCPKFRGLSAYEKEYLAVVVAVDQWRPYLRHSEFVIQTDQQSLIHLEKQWLTTPWQQKAFTKLLGLRYTIKYRKGAENSAADALSRATHSDQLQTISSCKPSWMEDVVDSYNSNPHAQKLLEQLAIRLDPKGRFTLDQGFPVTWWRVRRLFAWPKMKIHLQQYVKCCPVCQQDKPDRAAYPGLLEPLPVPKEFCDMITMDFINGLPQSAGVNCILIIVDKLTKFAHFLPLAHPYTASKVDLLYMNQVYRLHGFPGSIVSDRDPVFTSYFWQELLKYAGIGLHMSSPNHPQTDEQTERVNQCLETFLRCFTQSCPRRWSFWIPLAQFWYNSAYHSSIGMSPFRAMYGHEPRQWGITATSVCSVPALRSWLDERAVVQDLLQQHLNCARQCMKLQADKKRSFREFEVGDLVYLKLQPYIQTSVATRACHKLAFRFFGTYKIISRVNAVAYKLQLPEQSQVHPVFHVSQLRRALLPGTPVNSDLPVHSDIPTVPVKVLNQRWSK